MDRHELIHELRHCERMKTLTGQTATVSVFAAITWSVSLFVGGSPLFGLPLTALAAALFTMGAYCTWRSHERYAEESRSIEKRLADPNPRDLNKRQEAFSGVAKAQAERMTSQRSTLLH